jgi:hypothetical protein
MKKIYIIIIASAFAAGQTSAQIQAPNIGFENWETLQGPISNTYDEPASWNSSNECTALLNQFAVTKSSDAHSGSFSVRMETFQAFGNVRANGVITTADMICLAAGGGQEGGMAYSEAIPDSVIGWYKYQPANSDSGYSQVMFLSNNDMDTLSYTRYNFVQAVNTWTRFSFPLNPISGSQLPEKLSLFFSCSWGDGSQGQAEVGSTLYLDDVEFVFNPQGVNDIAASSIHVYPNPAVGEFNVDIPAGEYATLEVMDVTGKLVKRVKLEEARTKVNVSQLVAGLYIYQVSTVDNTVLKTGKLMINP